MSAYFLGQDGEFLPLFQGTDLTFITNEQNQTLKDRFNQLIKDSRNFDVLVGYFYLSGFHALYKSLENTEKIRILIGISTDQETYNLIETSHEEHEEDMRLRPSDYETKELIGTAVENEISNSNDKLEVEEGIQKFVDWIRSGKLKIKAYPSRKTHAKLYIMTFKEGDRDVGRVITGSSNFTQSGLEDNLEFNVELKNRSDYEFARAKFNKLWEDAVDVTDDYVQTITQKTWLNENVRPYELYLKLLYEYFKDELNKDEKLSAIYFPENFKQFKYQEQAVLNAKKILEEYGGVFISDVVGLGKTYVATMLASQLDGRTLIIAPPSLIERENPGSWPNVLSDFKVPADWISVGKLGEALEMVREREYKNIIIDEAHRFRSEDTQSYDKLSKICRGKRVILVSATPYNNSPRDILNLIKLFQSPRNSTIPGVPNLEAFFNKLDEKLQGIDKKQDYDKFLAVTRENAKEIRDKVLKYIMVRRTRSEIEKYFADDLKNNKIKFPEVEAPKPLFYELDDQEDRAFTETLKLLTQELTYSRYMPLLYLRDELTAFEAQSQRNMGGFMKVLLVKRLESSFYAFRKTVERFADSYEKFIKMYESGTVYVSKKYFNKIFELIKEDDEEGVQRLIDENKAERYSSEDFRPQFVVDLRKDLKILQQIISTWKNIQQDPKLETLIHNLRHHEVLKSEKSKIIIFTESKETAEYLTDEINKQFGEVAICFHGSSSETMREIIIRNFDARAREQENKYKILISTEVLAEGVNLHRSNIVINYDIPWNPTRMMQRVGRVNRIDTSFDRIYTFNFFPTAQADDEISLSKIAQKKIEEFLNLLGGDSAILTENEPVSSHELFNKLISKETLTENGEIEESELRYLRVIENVRDNDPEVFEKVKRLPKKARSSRNINGEPTKLIADTLLKNSLITFFRRGKLMKFFLSSGNNSREIDFLTTAKIFECSENEPKIILPLEEYYNLLDVNKTAFYNSIIEDFVPQQGSGGNAKKLIKMIKAILSNAKQLTEDQEEKLKKLTDVIENGDLPKVTIDKVVRELEKMGKDLENPVKAISVLQREIPDEFFKPHYSSSTALAKGKREVVLSLYTTLA